MDLLDLSYVIMFRFKNGDIGYKIIQIDTPKSPTSEKDKLKLDD